MKKFIAFIMVLALSFMLFGCDKSNSDIEAIEKVYESLFKDVDRQNVTSDLNFPSSVDEVYIVYLSSDDSVISTTGKVTRGMEDQVIVITINLSKNDQNIEKRVSFVVKKIEHSDTDDKTYIEQVYQKLFENIDKNNITSDLSFVNSFDGVTIKYSSSNESVISSTGKVTRQAVDTKVTIDIELTYNNTKLEKIVEFTVKKVDEIIPDTKALQAAFDKLVNFKLNAHVVMKGSDSGEYTVDYLYDTDKIAWVDSEGFEYYVVYENNSIYGIYNDEDGNYYKTEYDTDEFYLMIQYYGGFDDFYFDELDANDFEYKDGYYVPKADKLQDVAKLVIGDFDYEDTDSSATDVFNYFKIKVENETVVEIVCESVYNEITTDATTTDTYKYTLTFTDYNKVNITLPTISDEPDPTQINEIPEVYETENDLSVYTGGNVTGILGQYMYISNGNQSLTLYFDKNSEVDYSNVKIGDYIEVLGIKTEYKGLVEVSTITSLTIKEEKYQVFPAVDVTTLSELNKVTQQGTKVNLKNVVVKSVYEKSGTRGDYKLTVTDGTTDMLVFIKSVNESSYHDQLAALAVGDCINLNNFVVSWYNGVQVMAINDSLITDSYGLKIGTTVITVEFETELSDALNGIVLSYVTKDGEEPVELSACTVDSSTYNKSVAGTYLVTITYNDSSATVKIIVKRALTDAFKSDDATNLKGLSEKYSLTVGLPSTGDVNVLVFPIAFTDQTVPTNYKDTLTKAFNGTSEETGWESLNSYYQKSSYGKLNISATVMDVYNTNEKFNQSADYDSAIDLTYLHQVLSYYDSTINYNDYDANNDGYIDCVYLVYLAPYSTEDDSVWWAFTSKDETPEKYDDKQTDFYMFLSYDFFTDPFIMDDEDESKDVYININSQTIIHETGHALGLDDYYDYDISKGPVGGIGGGDMMDYNVGDHNAYSKTLLGWITPTILINKDYTATLKSFGASGDAIIVAKDWNNSYFGEYYIIDFYTCDGLNEASKGTSGLFAVNGVRIYHIDSTLSKTKDSIWEVTEYDNSYTAHKLIKLIEADGRNDIESTTSSIYGGYSEDSDLFQANDSIELKWYDGTIATTMTVNQITTDGANISFTFK